ncbi:MAG: GtrA family protein [Pseudomonadota bacterium]
MRARWLRFVLGGVLNTGWSYALYLALRPALGYQRAWLVAYAAGIVFAYWFNASRVFRVALSWRALLQYPLVYLVQYAASALLLHLLVERWGAASAWAPLPVAVLMLPLTFAMSRLLLVRDGR